jgi:hypothetical protein
MSPLLQIFVIIFTIILGTICGTTLANIQHRIIVKKYKKQLQTNTISEKRVKECICLVPDNCKSIDEVVQNLQNIN